MKSAKTIWVVSLFVKLALAAWLPIYNDEGYYWAWSHHLQLSYFDHPPFVAWLFWLGHPLEALGNAVRWPAVVMGHATLWLWYLVVKRFLNLETASIWLVLAIFMPLTGPGSLIVTPDIPLMFFWALSLLLFLRLVEAPRLKDYTLLGVALGLGFSAKYHMALFAILAIAWAARYRRWDLFRPAGLAVATVFFALTSAPVWIWNFANDWISFKFQLNHGLGEETWSASWTTLYVGGQIAMLFPAIVWWAFKARVPRTISWLPFFAWGPLVFFFATSFKGEVEMNWPAVGHPAVLALAALHPLLWRWWRPVVGLWAALLAIVLSDIARPWIPLPDKRMKTREHRKYESLVAAARDYQPLFTRFYQQAGKIHYETKVPTYKLKGNGRLDFYDFRTESVPNQPRYFLTVRKGVEFPDSLARRGHRLERRIPIDRDWDILEIRGGGG